MPRNILLADGMPRRFVIGGNCDPTTGIISGAVRTIYVDDDAPCGNNPQDLMTFIQHQIRNKPRLRAIWTAAVGQDVVKFRNFMDAVDASNDQEVVTWRTKGRNP